MRILKYSCMMIALVLSATGCKKSLISGFEGKVEPNLETVKVKMNFSDDVHSDLGGTFEVKHYGTIEVEPSTPDAPFNVGFRLNLDIVNDQEYVRYDPTTTLPSGQPIPVAVNRAMAQVKLKNEVNPNFDVYAYVDILGREWIGLAMTLKFIDNRYFPAGLSVSQNFLKDKDGRPRGVGAVFGPKVDASNNLLVPGGIAIFANAKALVDEARGRGHLELMDMKGSPYIFEGVRAEYYDAHPNEAYHLQEAFKEVLRANRGTAPRRDGRRGD